VRSDWTTIRREAFGAQKLNALGLGDVINKGPKGTHPSNLMMRNALAALTWAWLPVNFSPRIEPLLVTQEAGFKIGKAHG